MNEYICKEVPTENGGYLEPEKELIRCKDCKWFGNIGCAISIVDDTDKPSENDFCSFAERKEDGRSKDY